MLVLQESLGDAAGNTLVRNNPRLCFTPSIGWARQPESYIEYDATQVWRTCISVLSGCDCLQCSLPCPLHDVEGLCRSQCDGCGVVCEALPISDAGALKFYRANGCSIVQGDLSIVQLPMELSEADLHEHLSSITTVTGALRVHSCEHLTSLSFLSQLTHVGSVELVDNPSLVDARISSLMTIEGSVAVSGCPKLCEAYITSDVHNQTMSTDGCRAVDLTLFLLIAGDGDSLGTIDWSAASTALTAALGGAASSISGAVC